MFRGFVTFRWLHLIHAVHAVGFHRGDGLAEEDEVEAGEGLDGGGPSKRLSAKSVKPFIARSRKFMSPNDGTFLPS